METYAKPPQTEGSLKALVYIYVYIYIYRRWDLFHEFWDFHIVVKLGVIGFCDIL